MLLHELAEAGCVQLGAAPELGVVDVPRSMSVSPLASMLTTSTTDAARSLSSAETAGSAATMRSTSREVGS